MISTNAQVLLEAAALVEARQPFVMVTVVWRRAPSSGRQGAKALILADGSVRGWLGGACAEPTVIERALASLESNESELLFLGQGDALDERSRAEMSSVPMACESDGALEVYMEPVVPSMRVVVVGRSPAVDALGSMSLALGWDAVIVDDGGAPSDHSVPDIVHTKLDFDSIVLDGGCAVVVATQGHYDDIALAAALQTPAEYVGLVASEKRAASLLEQLSADGVATDELARVVAPAGVDLGPVDNVEIAASIIADLVARRARGELRGPSHNVARSQTVVDPICGMTVDPATAKYHSLRDGVDYWFCASGCKRAFEAQSG